MDLDEEDDQQEAASSSAGASASTVGQQVNPQMALLNQLLLSGDRAGIAALVQSALAGAVGSGAPNQGEADKQQEKQQEKKRLADAKAAEKARVAATKEAAKAAAKAEKEEAKKEQEIKKQNASILTLAVKSQVMLQSTSDSLKAAAPDLATAPDKIAEPVKEATKLVQGMLKECSAAVTAAKKKKPLSPLSCGARSLPKALQQAKEALKKLGQYKSL